MQTGKCGNHCASISSCFNFLYKASKEMGLGYFKKQAQALNPKYSSPSTQLQNPVPNTQIQGLTYINSFNPYHNLLFLKKIFIYIFRLCQVLVAARGIFVVACELLVAACMWDLVPRLGIEPGPPALGAQSLTHWTTREVPLPQSS